MASRMVAERKQANERVWQNGERTDAVSELQVDLVYARINRQHRLQISRSRRTRVPHRRDFPFTGGRHTMVAVRPRGPQVSFVSVRGSIARSLRG